MVQMYKELLPNDHFVISIPQLISMNERQLLTLFYQPMTGAQPISLYLTLWAEGEDQTPTTMNHYYLMNVLGLSIREIFEARVALEAIGLLRTYRANDEEDRKFIYELQRPLDAKTFFADPLLSMFLFSKIGEPAYRKLRGRFIQPIDKSSFKEVSRSFTDVFKPVHMRMDVDENESLQTTQQGYTFYSANFDFDLLLAGLSEQLVPTKRLTAEVREEIAKLAFMYKLTPIEMQKVVIMAFDHNMEFSYERLRKAASDYYKITVSKEAPKFEKVFKEQAKPVVDATFTKEQALLANFEGLSPIESLKAISGKEPLPATVQLIESLVARLPIGVVNVLLEYVMLTTDMRLPQKYVERIADHWALKKIATAKEAMELARQEHDKYANWKKENENKQAQPKKPNYNRRQTGRVEQVPDWFNERKEESKPLVTPEAQKALDFEKERQKILEKLGQNGQVKINRTDK